jgi:hypothetical protein
MLWVKPRNVRPDPGPARKAGFEAVRASEPFGALLRRAHPVDSDTWGMQGTAIRPGGLVAADAHGSIVYNRRAVVSVETWIWSLSHVLTHLGLGHTDPAYRDGRGTYKPEWRAACCLAVDRFLDVLHLPGIPAVPPGFDGSEDELARRFAAEGIPANLGTGGPAGGGPDLWEDLSESRRSRPPPTAGSWGQLFAAGLDGFEVSSGRRPPASWDAQLAAWFDDHFPALPTAGMLALPAPTSSSALDLRVPSQGLPEPLTTRTFGVLLGCSAARDQQLLGRALGFIASYATAHEVHRVRVISCDGATHDAGWLPPDQIAGHVKVGGHGGTDLQRGVDLLLSDPTFPAEGPMLFLTDGNCDQVRLHRDHVWLTSGELPFTPRGPVFHLV